MDIQEKIAEVRKEEIQLSELSVEKQDTLNQTVGEIKDVKHVEKQVMIQEIVGKI